MACDGFKLTQASGQGSAEGLWQYGVKPNDIMACDRAFCNARGINHYAVLVSSLHKFI